MIMRGTFAVCGLLGCVSPTAAEAEVDDVHAIVLLYHHVGDDTPLSTSVKPDVFEAHLDYLAEHDYTVLGLEHIVAALVDDEALPARSVALTFDDAYVSIYNEALPRLERRSWPFTVFVATDGVDRGYSDLMSWDQLRDLESRGGSIANHTTDHSHLVRLATGEDLETWRLTTRARIEDAQARLDAELDHPLRLLAYPYGEFDGPLEALAEELGYLAFGQQSGPIGRSSPTRQLPRFPITTGFDDLDSLAEKLRTRALPVTVLAPESRVLGPSAAAPTLQLRIPAGDYRRDALQCYVTGQQPARIDWRGDVATIRAQRALGSGRSKFNCTAPSAQVAGVFYWYSYLWIQPRDDGSWYSN